MQFQYEIQPDHLVRVLRAVGHALVTPAQLLGSIGESLLRVNDERHAQGLAPDGTRWAELSPLTQQTKRRPQMLYENGDLLRFQYQVQGDSVAIGTTDWKAIFHHNGTRPYVIRPKTAKALRFAGIMRKQVRHPGLPARPLVGFPDSDRRLTEDVVEDHLMAVLNASR